MFMVYVRILCITSQPPIIFNQSINGVKLSLCIKKTKNKTQTQQSFKGTGLKSKLFKMSSFNFPLVLARNHVAYYRKQ